VRPEAFIEINNFYTRTVYEKGAELCRMIMTIVGQEGFRKGIDLYFQRHDGTAATVEDFIAAMADANSADLGQFMLWYSQAGTPELTCRMSHS
jgi:aminopeptidase N